MERMTPRQPGGDVESKISPRPLPCSKWLSQKLVSRLFVRDISENSRLTVYFTSNFELGRPATGEF